VHFEEGSSIVVSVGPTFARNSHSEHLASTASANNCLLEKGVLMLRAFLYAWTREPATSRSRPPMRCGCGTGLPFAPGLLEARGRAAGAFPADGSRDRSRRTIASEACRSGCRPARRWCRRARPRNGSANVCCGASAMRRRVRAANDSVDRAGREASLRGQTTTRPLLFSP
jgi:hypothetical protein